MAFLQKLATRLGHQRLFKLFRAYPPYLGAGIAVTHVEHDVTRIDVEMKLRAWNQNFVGTHFGGSLYSMCDPFYMLMLIAQLGPEYIVWDKSASIEFLKPGRGTVRARFDLPKERVAELRRETDEKGKINPSFEVTVTDEQGAPVARMTKLLSIRRKDAKKPA